MRPSPLKHPVAILRKVIGLGQKELADLCGCSTRTIQAVELGPLHLSEGLASRISKETGVSRTWLLAGKVDDPPTAEASVTLYFRFVGTYTKAVFERHRALLESPVFKQGGDAIAAFQEASATRPKRVGRPQTMNARCLEATLDWLLDGKYSAEQTARFKKLMEKAKSGENIPIAVAKAVLVTFEEAVTRNGDAGLVDSLQWLLDISRTGPNRDIIRWRVDKLLTDLIEGPANTNPPESKSSKRKPRTKAWAGSRKHLRRPQG